MASGTDRIEKTVLLGASRARVWQAISDSTQFGTWFGVTFDGPFVSGARMTGRIVPTTADADVVFELEEVDGRTRLKITETGFDRVPLERRANLFAANQRG